MPKGAQVCKLTGLQENPLGGLVNSPVLDQNSTKRISYQQGLPKFNKQLAWRTSAISDLLIGDNAVVIS